MTVVNVNGNAYTVEIAFPASATFGNAFTLNDPVKGVLNSATYTLGGDVWADVTDYVTQVTTNRGRSRQTDTFNAGQATVVMRNESRIFDPSNTASMFAGGIKPRRPIRISVNGNQIFNGYIDDFTFDWETSNIGTVSLACSDGFNLLARTTLSEFTPSEQLSGARVSAILDRSEVSFPATRNIEVGASTLGAYQVTAGTTALDYLQDIATAEQGYLFVSGNGTLTFRGRLSTLNQAATITFADTEAAGTVPYQGYGVQYGTEMLFNRVVTKRVGGIQQVAEDAASEAEFLTSTLSYLDLLVSTDQQAIDIGTFLLGKYAQPELRVEYVEIVIASDAPIFSELMNVEIGDVVTVVKSFDTGTPLSLVQEMSIEGIRHRITARDHRVVFNFGAVDSRSFLELDDPLFGLLDSNLLAF